MSKNKKVFRNVLDAYLWKKNADKVGIKYVMFYVPETGHVYAFIEKETIND